MISEDDLEALGREESYRCEDCGKSFSSAAQLRGHHMSHAPKRTRAARTRTKARPSAAAPRRTNAEIELRQVEDKLVENLALVGMGLGFALPHTGITVSTRSGPIAHVLIEQARKDERVLRAIMRFNGLFGGGGAAMIGVSLLTAVALDVGVIGPDFGASLPLPDGRVLSLGPRLIIGDVIEAVEGMREPASAAPAPAPAPSAGPTEVAGGMDAT